MSAPASIRLSPFALFTLDPSQTGGRKARTGFDFQDQYIASVLAGFLVGNEDFLAARIEAVEDLDAIIRIEHGWLERYYQIKTRQEGSNRWTIFSLDKEGVWTRFFSLYRRFVLQQTDVSRRLEFVIAVEGDLDPELVELREKGPTAAAARTKLVSILSAAVDAEHLPAVLDANAFVDGLLDNFIATLRFDSRVGHLREIALNKLIASGDLSPKEADEAFDRLISSISKESVCPQPALITTSALRDWLGFPERAILQKKPVADPHEVRRNGLIAQLEATLENDKTILLYGIPKIGKSHVISALIDHLNKTDNYYWFTFSGGDRDKDTFVFQLALWTGQRTSIWQVKEDIQHGRLQPEEALKRLGKVRIGNAYLVIDDCHKARDRGFLEAVAALSNHGWSDAKIIFVSEEKIPELTTIGVRDQRITGFEPKEGIRFLVNLGIDVRDALVELGMLCIQADGHPALLRAIATELSARPSPAEVTNLSNSLISATAAQPFLQVLSERLMRSLKVSEHRLWLTRLASLTFSFRLDLAMEIARLEPAIEVNAADWNVLVSQVFDETGADQYLVPTLLRPLLKLQQTQPSADVILVASARHIFRTARASSRIDFWDFHSAIVALIVAKRYDEAAYHFIVSMAGSKQPLPLSALEILFMVLNGQLVHQALDAPTRFTLLLVEVNTRLLDDQPADFSKILRLFRQMHVALKQQPLAKAAYAKAMMHMLASLARLRRLRDKSVVNRKAQGRAFASIEAALRVGVGSNDSSLILGTLDLYNGLYFLAQRPDLELLKRAILTAAPSPALISGNSLISIYVQHGVARGYDDEAVALYERHSSDYRAASRAEPFFAAEYGMATILIERFGKYADARRRIAEASLQADALGASTEVLPRADLITADSYWVEKDYASSATYYQQASDVDFGDESLRQWTRERTADSLTFSQRFEEAALYLIRSLRRNHSSLSPTYKARLYARLAYAYAECNSLGKASIACLGLCRVAEASRLAEIDLLSVIISGWVRQHFEYFDPAIPQTKMNIRDSSALSESPSAEQLDAWTQQGPPLARGLILVGTLFELLGKFPRSEGLYLKAIEAASLDEDQSRFEKNKYTYHLRIARVQIREHRFAPAAAAFKSAANGLFALGRLEVAAATAGGATYAILTLVEPCFDSCSDLEVVKCFAELDRQFTTEPGIRSWLLYRESELLFGRLLVQSARRVLLEAEGLARSCDEYQLLWVLLHGKLFTHMEQMYRDQVSWFRDVLETGLLLAKDNRLAEKRPEFSAVVARLTAQFQSAIGDVAGVISGFSNRPEIDQFMVTLFALWKTARRRHFTIGCLSEIEGILRSYTAIASGEAPFRFVT